jgi:hypothetical protein
MKNSISDVQLTRVHLKVFAHPDVYVQVNMNVKTELAGLFIISKLITKTKSI